MEEPYNIDGILIVDKDSGMTSRDIVNRVSKLLKIKKIGHTGTLDPLATGVLVLTIGKCTKLNDYLTSTYKEYVAEFELGYETDTLDNTGSVLLTSNNDVTIEEIESCIKSFEKKYLQEVPKYSAVKVNGKKLYEYARNNEQVELPKKEVHIKEIEILSINEKKITIRCLVSKGTYIRSLIRDIGCILGTYATMTKLERTKQGNFSINESYTLENIEAGSYQIITIEELLKDVRTIEVDDELYKKVSNGVKLDFNTSEDYILFTHEKKAIALYIKSNNKYKMYVKF